MSKIEETIRKNAEKNLMRQRQEQASENWRKRQSIAEDTSFKIPPPPVLPAPPAPISPNFYFENKLSREEFHFFINAIEKMQLSSFFQVILILLILFELDHLNLGNVTFIS